jgi:hypothetical protein
MAEDRFYKELECTFDQFSEYYILLEFNIEVGREEIFKLTVRNEFIQN